MNESRAADGGPTMRKITGILALTGASMLAAMALAGPARADGEPGAAAAADSGREFTWSVTLSGTSEYIFRGIDLNDEDPAFQPSINFGYGILYWGLWGSNLVGDGYSPWETDIYAGIKPVLGPVTFDFGAVWYTYPGNKEGFSWLGADYVELKAGASFSPFTNLTLTPVFWYTPDQDHYPETWTIEGTAAYTLPACGIFTPTISGLVGHSEDTDDTGVFLGDSEYTYWNGGVALAVENFTFDFRYWDTTIDDGLADERFVFTASVTVP